MSGLFETMRVRGGLMPLLSRHVARLTAACQELAIAAPAPGVVERIRAHAEGDLIVRLTLDEGGERIETRPVPPPAPIRVVFSGTRHTAYRHKTTDRATFDRARGRVVPFRADEALLLTDDGLLAEGCMSSVFFWHEGALCTPSLNLGILPGVGRGRVLELARERGITVREGLFARAEVEGTDLFLVNAVRGVMETVLPEEWRRHRDERTALLAEGFWG